jgi:F0F1-type ATP synthase assembly protein I
VSEPTTPQPRPEDQPGQPSRPGQPGRPSQPGQSSQPDTQPRTPAKHPQRSEVQPRRKPTDQPNRWSTETEGPSPTAKADALGATVLAYLITGPALFGGLGYLLDHLLGTGFLVLVGVLGGMAASLYLVWLRYGTS